MVVWIKDNYDKEQWADKYFSNSYSSSLHQPQTTRYRFTCNYKSNNKIKPNGAVGVDTDEMKSCRWL